MRNYLYFLLILTLSLVIPICIQAQEGTVKRSSVIENYKGKPFYIHFVNTGETLTAIAKTYKVSTEEIIAENPSIDKGLKADMVIRIPVKAGSEIPETELKQQERRADPAKKSDSSVFLLYTVKKQETLYGISKQFNITVEDILNANPGMEVLQEGMEIKIPKNKSVAKTSIPDPSAEKTTKPDVDTDEILVKTGETLYSISKANNVTVDELIDLNPQLSGGLKAGMVIKLHKSTEETEPVPLTGTENSKVSGPMPAGDCYKAANLNTIYNIALLLPFAFDEATSALDAPVEDDPSSYENFNYMQFYAGFMLAADSLEKCGLQAKIHVLDADKLNDTMVIRQALRKPGMDKMDLLVGPMYGSSFTIASRFARKNEIPIVNPLSRRENITSGNPFVIKAQVAGAGVSAKLISFINKNYPGANVIAVQNDKKELKQMAEAFTSGLKSDIDGHIFTGTLQQSVFSTDQIAGVTKKLKDGVKNIVILFSNNKTAVPNFVSLLNTSSKTQDIILVGMDEWAGLELETEFLIKLNYHQVSSDYIDYESEATIQFINRFRNKYGAVALASKHAFLGYDIGWYFLSSLMWYGDNCISCLPGNKGNGLQYDFDFRSTKPGDGFQNMNVDILKLQDYKMVLVE